MEDEADLMARPAVPSASLSVWSVPFQTNRRERGKLKDLKSDSQVEWDCRVSTWVVPPGLFFAQAPLASVRHGPSLGR